MNKLNFLHVAFTCLLALTLTGCGMNGTLLEEPTKTDGRGSLTIYNGYSDDIVLKLYDVKDPTSAVRYIYVGSKSDVELEQIPEGNYMIRYSMGKEWDSDKGMFSVDRANFETDQVFRFEETETKIETSSGTRTEYHYSKQSFMLNAGGGEGNVTTSQIEDDEFLDKD